MLNFSEHGSAVDQLVNQAEVYSLLKQLAQEEKISVCRNTLDYNSTTTLVHEVYIKLKQSNNFQLGDQQSRLIRQLTQVTRSVIIDLLRKQQTQKRLPPGADNTPCPHVQDKNAARLFELDHFLNRFKQHYPRQVEVATLHYFGWLDVESIAEVLSISEQTAYNDLNFIRDAIRAQL